MVGWASQPADTCIVWMPDRGAVTLAGVTAPFSDLRNGIMPNPFDEYINKLEGNDSIDPLVVVRDLRELHAQELSTREEKINELNGTVADRDTTITAKDDEIRKWKAKNFDLAMAIPGDTSNNPDPRANDGGKPDSSSIKISDLFKPEVRRRHGL